MTTFPNSPKLLKDGIMLIDPGTSAVLRIIALQYNPDTLTRSFQVQGVGDGGDRSEALRLKGPPVETIKLEAEIDAADQLNFPEQKTWPILFLLALESIVYPSVGRCNPTAVCRWILRAYRAEGHNMTTLKIT